MFENKLLKRSPPATASNNDKATGMKYLLIDISQLYFTEYSDIAGRLLIAQVRDSRATCCLAITEDISLIVSTGPDPPIATDSTVVQLC